MTDKEFKRLKRADLIEIIYQLQTELEETKKQLEDRNIKIQNAGSIADAAVAINQLMETAQQTADQYVESVQNCAEEAKAEAAKIIEEAKAEAAKITEEAKAEADKITEEAKAEADKRTEEAKITEEAKTEVKVEESVQEETDVKKEGE